MSLPGYECLPCPMLCLCLECFLQYVVWFGVLRHRCDSAVRWARNGDNTLQCAHVLYDIGPRCRQSTLTCVTIIFWSAYKKAPSEGSAVKGAEPLGHTECRVNLLTSEKPALGGFGVLVHLCLHA